MISYFLQVSTAWCLFILIYQLFLKQEKYFRLNRWYLLGSIFIGLLLPFVALLPSELNQAAPVILPELSTAYHSQIENIADLSIIRNSSAQPSVSTWSWSTLLLSFYLLGVFLMMVKSLFSVSKLVRIITRGQAIKHQNYTEIKHDSNLLPFSFFNYVCFGSLSLDDDVKNEILVHELHHIRSIHSFDILILEIMKIIFWWNPLIYLYSKAIKENHEFSADAKVLQNYSRKVYCQLLMKATFPGVNLQLSNPFYQSFIKKRINMMYQKDSKRIHLLKYTSSILACIFLLILFAGPLDGQKMKFKMINSVIELGEKINGEEITVSIGDKKLTEGVDYKLNEDKGKLYLIDNETTRNPPSVNVEFRKTNPDKENNNEYEKGENECLKREDGVYFRTDIGPSVEGCESADREDEPYSCATSVLGEFARSIKQYPSEAIKEGFQGTIVYSLIINENGKLISWEQPKNMTRKAFGIKEEGDRIIEEIKRNFKFKPAICNEKNVKSRIPLSFRFEIGEEQLPLVEVKNIKTVKQLNQTISINHINQKGKMGFEYNSNMNVPSEILIINPKGETIFQKSYDYMYKSLRDYFALETPINGKYTIKAIQDGSEIKSEVKVSVFEK